MAMQVSVLFEQNMSAHGNVSFCSCMHSNQVRYLTCFIRLQISCTVPKGTATSNFRRHVLPSQGTKQKKTTGQQDEGWSIAVGGEIMQKSCEKGDADIENKDSTFSACMSTGQVHRRQNNLLGNMYSFLTLSRESRIESMYYLYFVPAKLYASFA